MKHYRVFASFLSAGTIPCVLAAFYVPDFPDTRFVLWDDLSDEQQLAATVAGFVPETWNNPGTADVEGLSYEAIGDISFDQVGAIDSLGFTEEQWDCYANHYVDYTWQELKDEGVQGLLALLGWNQQMWDMWENSPESEESDWEELTPLEKAAARSLCFLPGTWDDFSFQDFDVLPTCNYEACSEKDDICVFLNYGFDECG